MKRTLSEIRVLDSDDLAQIHAASINLLESVGMKYPNQEVLELLQKNGAVVDFNTQIAKFPARMVDQFVKMAAKSSRALRRDVDGLTQNNGTFKVATCGHVHVFDHARQERRNATREDLIKMLVLANQLENVGTAVPLTPADVPANCADVVMAKETLLYSRKLIRPWILMTESAEAIGEMIKIAYGEEKIRTEHPMVYTVEARSPLQYGPETLEIGLIIAKKGLDLGLGPIPMAGGTAPISGAGVLTLANTEAIGGVVLIQCLRPGQPMYYHSGSHTLDLRSMLCCYGPPSQIMLTLAGLQMARHYGLPCIANIGGTDSLAHDTQAGIEKGIGAALALAGGIGRTIDIGLVGGDQHASLEQLVIDNEWVGYLNRVFSGFEVNAETIGLDVIKKVGIGGNFLDEDHTGQHMNDIYWKSKLFTRDNWDKWVATGKESVMDRAHKRVQEILAEHYPPQPVLSPDKVAQIEAIANKYLATHAKQCVSV